MARANQEKWFADALVSYAQGYRSFEAVNIPAAGNAATPAMQPGMLLTAGGVIAATDTTIQFVLLQSVPARSVGTPAIPALVLARDAEVNDAYLLYGGVAVGAANTRLSALNIIVRPGVLPQSIVTASMLDEEGRMIEGTEGPHEPEPAAV
jgi:hypothetical protein